MRQLSTFIGEGEFKDRQAIVFINDEDIPVIEMYLKEGSLWDMKEFPNNTLQYAEDCAENFVLGIPK